MISLKQLVEQQRMTGLSDIAIIRAYFDANDLEEEGMELIYELSQSKIEKLKRKHRIGEEWISVLPSKHLYEEYDLDTADKLHTLELNYLSHGGELTQSWLKWAEENLPNIPQPKVYFIPLLEYLDERDIRFKNQKPMDHKMKYKDIL